MATVENGKLLPNSQSLVDFWGLSLMLAVLVAGYFLFGIAVTSLFDAWQRPEYSHGYFIPVIALLIALKRYRPVDGSGTGTWYGLAIMIVAVSLGVFGNLAGVADIATYGLMLGVVGLCCIALGLKAAFRLWPAFVYLAFMLPLPNFVYWPLSIKLQFLSSKIGVALISLMGIPVYLEGNIIDLGNYQLQVAEACSGLRYLFPLMSFGFLVATLYRGPAWQKVLLFLSSIPITIFMNSARIGVIGFLVNKYGIAQAEGFLHLFEGWVVFALCIALLLLFAYAMQKLLDRKRTLSDAIDLDFEGLLGKTVRLSSIAYSPALAGAAAVVIATALASPYAFQHQSIHPNRIALEKFPMEISGWKGQRQFLSFEIERVLAADDYLQADFLDPGAGKHLPVNFLVSYYQSQTEGSGIHSPQVCIPAGGWEVSRWEQAPISLAARGNQDLVVNRAIIEKQKERQLVYYWFEQRGRQMTNDYVAKAYTVFDSITRGRTDGALIRVITPIDSAGIPAAEDRLHRFLELVSPKLPDFVPP